MAENMNNEEKKLSRGAILDIIVSLIAVVSLVGCCFFWKCKYDLPATILAFAIVLTGSGFLLAQHKKNNFGANL